MTDIAELGFKVDTAGIKKAGDDLDGMAKSAKGAEKASGDLGDESTRLDGAMAKLATGIKYLAGPAVLGAAISGVFSFARGVAKELDVFDALAQKTDLSASKLNELSYIANLSKGNLSSLSQGYKFLSKSLAEAATGNENLKQKFMALGVSIEQIKALDTQGAFYAISDAFAASENGALKTKLAMDIFGRSGEDVIATLNVGSDGMREMTEEMRALGLTMEDDAAAAAGRFNDEMFKLEAQVGAVKRAIAGPLISALLDLVTAFNNARREGIGLLHTMSMIAGKVFGNSADEVVRLNAAITEAEKRKGNFGDKVLSIFGVGAEKNVERMKGELRVLMKPFNDELAQMLADQEKGFAPKLSLPVIVDPPDTKGGRPKTGRPPRSSKSDLAREAEKLARELAQLEAQQQREIESLHAVVRGVDPAIAAFDKYSDTLNQLWIAYDKGVIPSMQEYSRLVDMATESFLGLGKEQKKTLSEIAPQSASIFETVFTGAVERVDSAFSNLFVSMFRGFDDFRASLTQSFQQLLGEMAYAAVKNRILIGVGVASPGTAMAGGGGGAGGILSGLSGMLSGISGGAGLAASNIGAAGYFGAAGANMALAGSSLMSGAFGTAIGAVAPYAIPALIAGAVLKKIFGKKKRPQLTLGSGGVAGDFKGDFSTETEFGQFGVISSRKIAAEQLKDILGAVATSDASLAAAFGDIAAQRVKAALEGWRASGTDVEASLRDRFGVIIDALDTQYRGLIMAGDSLEELTQRAVSVNALTKFISGEMLADMYRGIEDDAKGLADKSASITRTLSDLASAFDGSTKSLARLAETATAAAQLQAQLLAQISTSREGIASSFSGSRESILTSVMDAGQKYAFFEQRANEIATVLQTATDPQTISRLYSEAERYIMGAFGALSDEQKQGATGGVINTLAALEQMAQNRLNEAEKTMREQQASIAQTIDSAMHRQTLALEAAAAKLTQSAAAIQAASVGNYQADNWRLVNGDYYHGDSFG